MFSSRSPVATRTKMARERENIMKIILYIDSTFNSPYLLAFIVIMLNRFSEPFAFEMKIVLQEIKNILYS